MKKPNIIFYFSDQQRADTCGCYGQDLNVTPELDALAGEGIRFEYAFTPQPVCGPCRALFQTGQYPTTTGCFRNNIALPADCPTLGDYFTEGGYETAYVGKWHLASEGDLEAEPTVNYHYSAVPPERRGGYRGFWRASDVLEFTSDGYGGYLFDESMKRLDFKGYRADCMGDYALDFLETRDRTRPFFLTVSQLEPHHQNGAGHYQGPVGSREEFGNFTLPGDLREAGGDAREEYADYLGACAGVDRNLGRLIRRLREEGIYEDTVIIYTSDHGSHFRTRNRDGHLNGYDDYKRTGHDGALRVPLVIRGGAFRGGRVISDLVSTAGLPRTLLAIAGIGERVPMIGEDLAQVAAGMRTGENEVFAQISESRVGRVIRTPRYCYGVFAPGLHGGKYGASTLYADDYLYDMERDPHQQHNLIGAVEYGDAKRELRERLLRWIREEEMGGDSSTVRIID